ncbi:hypothetical protein OIE66_39285 [Nonomuraea sp. NBC_01738]|uniref:hypothetical protein n=1 Tax=Nonomuraea sp. NBC_01738 TaxID=2976003 RepID=UPI002E1589E8|nr:hypothetical protein OIE66_39285 [Nonomuraea sp. NBC_01738]
MSPELLYLGAGIVVALIVLILLFKATSRQAEPNEALIISGLGAVTLSQAERDARIAQAEAEARETELRATAQASQVKQAAAAEAQAAKARGPQRRHAERHEGTGPINNRESPQFW